MSINYSPLKLSSKNIPENYISNTSPNDEQHSIFNNYNHYSSFPIGQNIQGQNITNNFPEEKADSSFQKISFIQNNFSQNELINSFQNTNNENNNENFLLNELRKKYNERIIRLHDNIKIVI